MIGTLFVADKAYLVRIPGNTSCLVDMSDTHLDEALFFNRKRPDRFCRTNSAAKIAEFLTIPNPGNESRRIKAGEACFQEC
jgi:hypothetical protein